MRVELYGIPNCETVKKALAWLADHDVNVQFHNFKKEGLAPAKVKSWLKQVEWSRLLNRKGTTWRKLDEETQASITTAAAATRLMCEQPSIVKRPVVEYGAKLLLGFDPQHYAEAFKK
ncbi:MAG TPA: ArsC family reductase [Burkholderiales bacterium]|nr:ArsC family reductase [Burkholderiales bacterium]